MFYNPVEPGYNDIG